jgi:hypothetical protein
MLTLLALMLGFAAGEQQATSGVFISADEIAATLNQSIANNTVDQPIKLAQIPGGHKASLALLRRTKAETTALIHDSVTEIYEIVEGSGTLVTGGTLEDPKPNDLRHEPDRRAPRRREPTREAKGCDHRAGRHGASLQRARRPDHVSGVSVRAKTLTRRSSAD